MDVTLGMLALLGLTLLIGILLGISFEAEHNKKELAKLRNRKGTITDQMAHDGWVI